MNNRSGRDSARRQAQASKQPPASQPPQEASSDKDTGQQPKHRGPVHLKSPQSLERLRDRVKTAARELERLRKENSTMAERIRALEARPAVDLEGTVLAFSEDPDTLREKIEGFIEAIDRYLARENG